jgi:hypothetical protein
MVLGEDTRENLSYEFGVVASATRAGVVKTWHRLGWGDDLVSPSAVSVPAQSFSDKRVYVLPAATIDVDGVLGAAKLHCWPDHPGQPQAFATLSEARECARPFVKG